MLEFYINLEKLDGDALAKNTRLQQGGNYGMFIIITDQHKRTSLEVLIVLRETKNSFRLSRFKIKKSKKTRFLSKNC